MKPKKTLLLLALACTTACIHKPSGPVSAWERVNVNMAALAQINNDVAKGVIALQQVDVITVQQAARLLNFQETVAKTWHQHRSGLVLPSYRSHHTLDCKETCPDSG